MERTRHAMVVMAVWLGLVIRASAQPMPAPVATPSPQAASEIPLYPGAAPGSEKWDWSERSVTTATGLPMVQDVVRPVLLHYPADRDKAVGTAMIVAPGGGFRTLMMSYEGVDIARRLNAIGIDAFVLKYRLLYAGPGAPSRPASGAAGVERPKTFSLTGVYQAQAGQDLIALAVDDGRQAVRLVRERAGEFGVRPDRIGMMGFSAGGLVTSEALFGPAATRPDFAAIIYGVGEIRETPSPAPPLFLAAAADDVLAADRTVEQFTAYRKGKGSAELHVFQMGAHGFVNKGGGADRFMDRLEEWLVANKLLVKSPTAIRLVPKSLDDMTERRAPSVLVTNTSPRPVQTEMSNDEALPAGNVRSMDLGGASLALDKYPFFPFCIDWHDAKKRSFEQQAQMLKELGYPGVGHIWLDNVEERIKTLDAAGLKLFQITMAVEVAPGKIPYDADRFKGVCNAIRGRGVQFCLLLNGMKPSDPTVDAHAVDLLRAMSDQAKASGAPLLLYPHQNSWIERLEDAIRVADKVDRPNVGVMFNLCHWLRVDSRRDYRPLLQRAMPRLWAVSINGADEFDEKPGWERYIQPLDRGSFDVGKLLGTLKELGYKGPIGLQCYGIGGDAREHLARSMAAWQKLSRNLKD